MKNKIQIVDKKLIIEMIVVFYPESSSYKNKCLPYEEVTFNLSL